MTPAEARDVDLLGFLYQALASEIGIEIEITEEAFNVVRSRLYFLRKANPRLHSIAVIAAPEALGTKIWLMKKADQ